MLPSIASATSGGGASLSSDILSTAMRPLSYGSVCSLGRPSLTACSIRSSSIRASASSIAVSGQSKRFVFIGSVSRPIPLLELDVGEPDDLGPLGALGEQECRKLLGRAADDHAADGGIGIGDLLAAQGRHGDVVNLLARRQR